MIYDVTQRVRDAWEYFDSVLEERIGEIAERSGVEREHFVKINPAEFLEKNKHQVIREYQYIKIQDWIVKNKKDNQTFLISPVDAIEETAAQVSYKSGTEIRRTLRASKCEVLPVPPELALDFFIRNHRQSAPHISGAAVCFGLAFQSELVAVMLYDISNGAVRGNKREYELVRLSIGKGTMIHGGASKLQQACEVTLAEMGQRKIYSYSNATINSGAVYEKLGFDGSKVDRGQPFVIMKNNDLVRLANLHPDSTDEALALRGQLRTHLGGNRIWTKEIGK